MRRSRLALAAVVLWLVGLEVVPNLHLALHDYLDAHAHVGDSIVFAGAHRHADGSIHRPTPAKRRHDAGRLAIELEHGAHSLAHHAIGVRPTLPALVVPLPVDRRGVVVAQAPAREPIASPAVCATARGPPANAS